MSWPNTKRELQPSEGKYGFHHRISPPKSLNGIDRIRGIGGYFPDIFDVVSFESSRTMQLFLAVYELELLNKLSDEGVVNGEQLAYHINPEYNGIATYELDKWVVEIAELDYLGIMRRWKLNTPTHGYGYDEAFYLTDEILDLIKDRPERAIKKIVGGILASREPIKLVDED